VANSSTRTDPYRSFNFRVEIDGTTIASFSEVSGLMAEGDSVDYREGRDAVNSVRKLIGLRAFKTPITLKVGYTQDSAALWDWYTAVATGAANARRSGSVVLRDETQKDVIFFNFSNGFLNKIEGPHLTASGNEVAIESAEIVHEGLTIKLAK
jgi:phage tail-like protein